MGNYFTSVTHKCISIDNNDYIFNKELIDIDTCRCMVLWHTKWSSKDNNYFNNFMSNFTNIEIDQDKNLIFIKIVQYNTTYVIFYALENSLNHNFLNSITKNYNCMNHIGPNAYNNMILAPIISDFNKVYLFEFVCMKLDLTVNQNLYKSCKLLEHNLFNSYKNNIRMFIIILYNYLNKKYLTCRYIEHIEYKIKQYLGFIRSFYITDYDVPVLMNVEETKILNLMNVDKLSRSTTF